MEGGDVRGAQCGLNSAQNGTWLDWSCQSDGVVTISQGRPTHGQFVDTLPVKEGRLEAMGYGQGRYLELDGTLE
jgi:hypothetical protein